MSDPNAFATATHVAGSEDTPERTSPASATATERPETTATLTVARAAKRLGVHANTIRTWTDQGRLRCLRINARGDRRYLAEELDAFIAEAARESTARIATAAARAAHDARRKPLALGLFGDEAALDVARDDGGVPARDPRSVVAEVARLVGERSELRNELRQATELRRVAADLSARLDPIAILDSLLDHTRVLFRADRAAGYLVERDGSIQGVTSRNLSETYLAAVRGSWGSSPGSRSIAERRPVSFVGYAEDPAAGALHDAAGTEGFDTVTVSPLFAGDRAVGVIELYHDTRRPWSIDDLGTLGALTDQAGVALANATDYSRMAGWAAQLQSIQSLAARLTGMLTVREIGMAMAGELDQLIDYHSIRIYRISGDDLVPVAWRGNAGIYLDTDGAELRGRVGRGIVGWVAEHGVAQYVPNASLDPRGVHIPGTPEIEESMLVAPLACEGRSLGVVALSKLGVDAFTEDHERLLQIYATFAAQAMANADANEQLRLQSETLRKQLHSQRELLRVTESLLTTLDPRAVLEEIADRLGALVEVDNLVVDLHDRERGILEPIVARGTHAAEFLARPLPDDEGVCGWVLQHGIGQLVPDELADPRVAYFAEHGPVAGTLIVVPLRGRVGVAGVMTLERLGPGREFTGDEFDLVQLFGAQASIALQNAETHQEISVRAQTDALTGLRNQGTFHDVLGRWVARSDPFSLLIIDLDHFKGFNDRHGHQAGNRLLKAIAKALVVAGRDADAVFRYGGDEFAVLLPSTDPEGAYAVATKLSGAIRHAGRDRTGPGVTASIGIATFRDDGATRESVLLAADRACYAAKRTGRDRVASAEEGRSLAGDFLPTTPTPVDVGGTER